MGVGGWVEWVGGVVAGLWERGSVLTRAVDVLGMDAELEIAIEPRRTASTSTAS